MRRRGRGLAFAGAVLVALALGAVFAYADTVSADGDTVTPNNNLTYTPSASFAAHCSDRGPAVAGLATINFNGGRDTGRAPHYDPGATVTVTDVPDAPGAAGGITASGGTGTVPAAWDTIGQSFGVPLSTTVPLTVPNGTYIMTVTASGPAHDSHGVELIHETSDTYKVSVACGNTSPVIAWAANPSAANEGDTKSYAFSISDPDSTSWTFAAGFPSCGAGGTLMGTPSIDSSAQTGTFDCAFPNGPSSSTVSAQISDETNTSFELDQAVAIANVAPSVSFSSAPTNALEGETKSYAFTVSDPGTADTYSGTPDCGAHGTYVAGSLTLSGSSGSQTGSFQCTFPTGSASTTVSLAFTDSDGSTSAPAAAAVTVQDAPLTAGTLAISDGAEGATASHLTFGFTDAYPGAIAAEYATTIAWGDGVSSPGIVTASPGSGFTVSGTHTYAEEGSYTVSVGVLDDGGSSTTATGSAHVADAALTAGTFTVGDGVEGTTPSPLDFSFTDANPGAIAADFTATITWGDGNSSVGTVTARSGGGFDVSASHTYALQGSYTAGVNVTDNGGSRTSATGSAHVADAPLTGGALTISNGVEGVTASNLTFTFTDANPAATANQQATIDWGDGSSSPGTVAAAGAGTFRVTGSHPYAEEGTFHATVTVTGDGGSTAVGHGDAPVGDALLTSGTLTVGNGVEGVTSSQLSFRFTDANPAATAADFTATINWGDGASSTGAIAAATGGGFTVSASHRYGEEGTYNVTVAVSDHGGSTTTAASSAQIADAPLTASAPASITSVSAFSGTTASFTDANSTATVADFTATINWGDGSSSVGVVAAAGSGFTVRGSHSYSHTGSFTVKTTIVDDGGSTASASTQSLTYAFPRHGAYVIGDRSATGAVTFFSGDWAKKNVLSGGRAPSDFKGHADSVPACHVNWTSRTGEGDDDESTDGGRGDLPTYMAVIVSSSITKSKDRIAGNTVRFVIVKVDLHGDHHDSIGTGTVVGSVSGC